MSIQPPNGILDITGATLRVSKMEFSNVTGFDTVLNNVARNTVLHVDTTEYTANVAYAVKPPNMFMAQFDLELSAGGTGTPCNFNYYNDSNLGTSFNGYNLSFNDTSIILTYDGGSALHTATLSSSLNNGVYRKVKVLFDRDTTLVSINGENVFRFKDTLRPRTYDTGTTGYIRWWHNSPVARKIKNLKVSNGEKWAQEYDSGGTSSNISYTHGLVGVGTSVPEYTLDVAGDIRATGNLIVNGSNTLINTTSLAIEDNVIECGKGNSSAAKDLGFLMVRNDGSSTTNSNVAMFWDESTDALTFGFSDSGPTATTLTPNTTKTLNSYFAGNVGIGTNNPGDMLHVYKNGYTPRVSIETPGAHDAELKLKNSNGQWVFRCLDSSGDLRFNGTSGLKLQITQSGNVGIGTGTVDGLLHLFKLGTGANNVNEGAGIKMERYDNYGCAIWSQFNTEEQMAFRCAHNATDALYGTPQMVLTHGGKLGIGTNAPLSTLQVGDGDTTVTSGGASGSISVSGTGATKSNGGKPGMYHRALVGLGVWSDAQMSFEVNGYDGNQTEAMRISSSGNLGVGTANPGEKLHVHENLSTSNHQIAARIGGHTSSYNTLVFGSKDGRPHIGGHRGDYGLWADLSLQNDLMVLKQSTMSVGIGTNDPKSALHVTGAVNYNNNNTPGVEIGVHVSTYAAIELTAQSSHQSWIDFKNMSTDSDYKDRILAGTGHMQLYTSNAERMRIDSSGNVGIGTNSPQGQLHIGPKDNNHIYLASSNNTYGWKLDTDDQGSGNVPFRIIRRLGGNDTTALFIKNQDGRVSINSSWADGRLTLKASSNNDPNEGIRFNNASGYWWAVGPETATTSTNSSISNIVFSFQGTLRGYVNWSSGGGQMNFTGQHRTFVKDIPHTNAINYEGMIVSADQNKYIKMSGGIAAGSNAITTNESLPIVSLTTKVNDKKCFGVISASEDPETRETGFGNFISVEDKELGDTRVYINSVGEGAIWVTDLNGSLESGDYITTSNVVGYGQKQDDDILHNYTVAKITMDCDFEPATQPVQTIKKQLGNVKYWVKTAYSEIEFEEYSKLDENKRRTRPNTVYSNEDGDTISVSQYNSLSDSNVQATYSETEGLTYEQIHHEETTVNKDHLAHDGWTTEVREEMVNVLNEHNEIQWEDHPTETEKAYKIRYLDADGKITTEANKVYTAAFVGCTYHCG